MSAEAFEIAQAVLLALGGGGAIVLVLSSWIGKIWAERILANEKHTYDKQLDQFKTEIQFIKERASLNYQQKLELYKAVTGPLVEISALINRDGLTADHVNEFDRQRLYITSHLVLFAPENVVHSFNDIVDYLYNSLDSNNYEFYIFRGMAMQFLSEMRKDIGIYLDDVRYKGNR